MTLKGGVVYLVSISTLVLVVGQLHWGYKYVVQGWGVYALEKLLLMTVGVILLTGLNLALQRDRDQDQGQDQDSA